MKLLYLFPEPLPLPRARGIQVAHTVVELAKSGLQVELVHAAGDGSDPIAACGLQRPANLYIASIARNLPWPLERVRSNRIFFLRLRRRLHQVPAGTVVMVRHIKLAAMLARHFPQLPLLYEAHEVFAETAAPAQRQRIERDEASVVQAAAAIVTNSGATAAALRERYAGIACPVEVIPNGVDLPEEVPAKDWSAPHKSVIYAGSFFGWKGVADLVAAAAELPGFRIRLIGGDQTQGAALQQGLPRAKAELLFEGRQPHARVMAELALSCIAVLPNRPDTDSRFTSPIKLFEYMGAGCAVVASDLPSVREILADDEAAWFNPGDPASLVAALCSLAADPAGAREMGERLRQKARQYTWAARAEKLARLIAGLSQGAGR